MPSWYIIKNTLMIILKNKLKIQGSFVKFLNDQIAEIQSNEILTQWMEQASYTTLVLLSKILLLDQYTSSYPPKLIKIILKNDSKNYFYLEKFESIFCLTHATSCNWSLASCIKLVSKYECYLYSFTHFIFWFYQYMNTIGTNYSWNFLLNIRSYIWT